MNLHEFQAKQLFRNAGMPTPKGEVVSNKEEAISAFESMGLDRYVVKAQVHAGGRGKAGGVRIITSKDELSQMVTDLLGTRLVTYQTDDKGQIVHQLLIEEPSNIERELYLSALIDRETQTIVIIASSEGGVEIEEVAKNTPDAIAKIEIDPLTGVLDYQLRILAKCLKLTKVQLKPFVALIHSLVDLFKTYDLSLVEINPLVVTDNGQLVCLDGKINVDENALYRQPLIRDMRDPTQEDARENHAKQWDLNYIALDGNIGCMVNGAGLAMATMDMIKLHGGLPANFLDVGGSATKERVTEAFKIILSDQDVQAILVNIFGGIVRCDIIADGIIEAVAEAGIHVPVVVRLEGNNKDLGAKKLSESGLNIMAEDSFEMAAQKVVAAATGVK